MYKITGFIRGRKIEKIVFADNAKEAVRFFKAKFKIKKISLTVISILMEEKLKKLNAQK